MLEETTDYVPFEDGKQFELCIYVHYNEYKPQYKEYIHTSWLSLTSRPKHSHLIQIQARDLFLCLEVVEDKGQWHTHLWLCPSNPAIICEDDASVQRCLPDLSVCLQLREMIILPHVKNPSC